MKLINKNIPSYIGKNITRGTISMSQKEFEDVKTFLKKQKQKAIKECLTYERDSLKNGIDGITEISKKKFSITIYATVMIVIKYKLNNYKNHNYLIIIK